MYSGGVASTRLQRAAYACPPGFNPDIPQDHADSTKSWIKCNLEMMRRIMSLSSPSVREEAASNLAPYVPYVVMGKGPYNYTGTDSIANMTRKSDRSIAATGQTEADLAETVDETQIIDAQKLRTLAGVT